MKAAVLTSNAQRHAYYAQVVGQHFDLRAVIKEPKGDAYYKKEQEESSLVAQHFQNLKKAEQTFFGQAKWPEVETRDVPKDEINDPKHVEWIKSRGVEVVFLFGTSILRDVWLDAFPDRIINIHLGLSPFYRGSATLFWPLANSHLECVGATIHLAEKRVDAGRILARVKPKLEVGDDYYAINYKTIRDTIEAMPNVAQRYLRGEAAPTVQNLEGGLLYKKKDFNEIELRKALDFVGAGLTQDQIDAAKRSARCAC